MAINFDLNDLLAFRAVAELSNFRKAAEVGAHFAAGVQPPHRQAGAGSGCAAARAHHAAREPDGGGPRLRAQGRAAARRSRPHAAGHPRCGCHAHGRGGNRVRAVDRLLLSFAGDPSLPRALPQGPHQGVRCRRERGARRRGRRRGRLRAQLHRQPGDRHRVQAAAEGPLRRARVVATTRSRASATRRGAISRNTTTSR